MKTVPFFVSVLALVGGATVLAQFPANDWVIGPIIKGRNYSVGMPMAPVPTRSGWYFDFPQSTRADGHVHYVTVRPGQIANKSRVIVRYRVTIAKGARFVAQEHPDQPATVSLHFQRYGDNWSGKGRYAAFRWYAPEHSVQRIAPGTHEMIVDLDDPQWVSVWGTTRGADENEQYRAALEDASRIGLVFGSAGARGHGVYATGPARFELLSFEVQ